MRAFVVPLLLATACGRINFDRGLDNGSDGSLACTTELCDGVDNNCNDQIDEDCSCVPFDTTFPIGGLATNNLAWTGDGYLVATRGATLGEYQLVRVDATGTVGSATTTIAVPNQVSSQAIAWNGNVLAVVWTDQSNQSNVYVQRFDATPMALGPPTLIGSSAFRAAVEWNDDRFVVVWDDGTKFVIVELGSDGAPLAPPVSFETGVRLLASFVPTSSRTVFIALDLFAASVVTYDGVAPVEIQLNMDGELVNTDVVRGDTGFAVLGEETTTMNTRAQLIAFDGTLIAGVTPPAGMRGAFTSYASIAPAPFGYEVITIAGTNPVSIYAIGIDRTGAIVMPATEVATFIAGAWTNHTSAAAHGRHAVAFQFMTMTTPVVRLIQRCL